MANELTGDFEGVLQVSGTAINRLMATLHQNAGNSEGLPGHPHIVSVHLVGGDSIDGVLGWVHAQVGVPRIELLDGATDRFDLIANVRAHFDEDAGSTYLPQAIHGEVRATYLIDPIDPHCRGWKKHTQDYLWSRVLKDTARFNGTVSGVDDPEVKPRIERLIGHLLENRFEAAPHKVYKRFRPGQMRSLTSEAVDAVALPISVSGADPFGQVSSMQTNFLDGHDFAVALNADALTTKLKGILDAVYNPIEVEVPVKVTALGWIESETTYHFTVKATKVDPVWEGNDDSTGSIKINAAGDILDEDNSVVATFTVEHRTTVSQDQHIDERGDLVESLTFMPSYFAHAVVSDVPWLVGLLAPDTKHRIESQFQSKIAGFLANLGTASIPLTPHIKTLVEQLRTLDDKADVNITSARFRGRKKGNCVLLRGEIKLSPRKPPVISFTKSPDNNSFTALSSWAPGGWIERFVWSWFDGATQQSATIRDRYTLSRPKGTVSKWGLTTPGDGKPLPGLDRPGSICLETRGFQVDSVTGTYLPFHAKICTRYGVPLSVDGKMLQTIRSGRDIVGIMDVGGAAVDPGAANVLVVYSRGRFDRGVANTLAAGLDASMRNDAGLTILAVVGESAVHPDLAAEAEMLSERIGARVEVVEDVTRSWTRRLAIPPDEMAWRLITPNGAFTWSHDGDITPDELGRALDDHLRPSPPPPYRRLGIGMRTGIKAAPIVVQPSSHPDRRCPMRLPEVSEGLLFVASGSHASEQQIAGAAEKWRQFSDEAPDLVVIVDGNDEEAERISQRYTEMTVIADTNGQIANRFGVRIWPTFVGIDQNRIVREVRQELFQFDDERAEPSSEGDAS